MPRLELYRDFVERWTHSDYRPKPESGGGLDRVEHEFGFRFPIAYREYMIGFGAGGPTIALLNAIVELNLDMNDLGEMYSSQEVIQATTDGRTAGLPAELVAIAADSSGNQFCLNLQECGMDPKEDSPIWFFDHDFGEKERIADGFEAWLRGYCELPEGDYDHGA